MSEIVPSPQFTVKLGWSPVTATNGSTNVFVALPASSVSHVLTKLVAVSKPPSVIVHPSSIKDCLATTDAIE